MRRRRTSFLTPLAAAAALLVIDGPGPLGGSNAAVACPPSPPGCEADLDGCGEVSINDLLILFQQWGPCPGCLADLDGNNVVDIADLLLLLSQWGPCP